jgi:hypothetical protein
MSRDMEKFNSVLGNALVILQLMSEIVLNLFVIGILLLVSMVGFKADILYLTQLYKRLRFGSWLLCSQLTENYNTMWLCVELKEGEWVCTGVKAMWVRSAVLIAGSRCFILHVRASFYILYRLLPDNFFGSWRVLHSPLIWDRWRWCIQWPLGFKGWTSSAEWSRPVMNAVVITLIDNPNE